MQIVRLMVVNFTQTKAPYGTAVMSGFELLTPAVYRQAERTTGFVARAAPIDDRTDLSFFERDWGEWGPFEVPRYYRGGTTVESDSRASALSVWHDIGSLYSFVFSGVHMRAIKRKETWFEPITFPTYAMWWDKKFPTWGEASRRLETLAANGDTSAAFSFRRLFDANGDIICLRDVVTEPLTPNRHEHEPPLGAAKP